jgi:NADH:ubiquinone oxidoreductase subunit 6 (subunit J)
VSCWCCQFLAITLILVYVGAVMVLFLFVIKMLNIDKSTLRAKFAGYLPLGLLVLEIARLSLHYARKSLPTNWQ